MTLDHFFHDSISPKLTSLDQNLESILASFRSVLSTLRVTAPTIPTRRLSAASGRHSLESTPDDWFDAQSISGVPAEEGLITVVEQESENDDRPDESSEDEDELQDLRAGAISPLLTMAPKKSRVLKKELYPLGEWRGRVVKRRRTLPVPIIVQPPSLLAFLRKNVSAPDRNVADFRWGKISARLQCQWLPMSQLLSCNAFRKI